MALTSPFTRLGLKRGAVAAGAALVLVTGAAGIAGAQQATPTRPSAQGTPGAGAQQAQQVQQRLDQHLSTLAGKLGVTVEKLRQAITDTHTELGVPQRRGFGPFGGRGGPGGPGRPGGPGLGFPGLPGVRGSLDTVAQTLNMTVDALRQELVGKTLADVARAHNVDPARVATALKNEANTKIDQAVTNGRLTAEQATQAKQRASTEIDALMTRQLPAAPELRRVVPGDRGPRGQQGPATTPRPTT